MKDSITRRGFIRTAAAASAALAWVGARRAPLAFAAEDAKPAVLGGKPVRSEGWIGWPQWRESWEPEVLKVLRSRRWFRGNPGKVDDFEAAYAKLLGANRCLATASGTTALQVALHVAGVDAGDEVITSPFTFSATYNAVLMHKALPVFADTDPATMTMDPKSIESRITDRTRAILPVHIYGMPCDMDPINAIARQHKLAVVEDACQAWLGEYKGKKCGVLGDMGCFSFQESKHLPSGEGGAITGNDENLMDRCRAFHNCGRPTGGFTGRGLFTRGANYRMQHFQAALLVQQMDKLVEETARRRENADYLRAEMAKIPGLQPAKLPENSRAVWHLFPFNYDPKGFNGLSREAFMRAMNAEGIPCSWGYSEQYNDGIFDETIDSRGFKRLFSAERLKAFRESFRELAGNRQVVGSIVAFGQNMLLGPRKDMDDILEAMRKVHAHSAAIAKA
jgi:perosamine synthetase